MASALPRLGAEIAGSVDRLRSQTVLWRFAKPSMKMRSNVPSEKQVMPEVIRPLGER